MNERAQHKTAKKQRTGTEGKESLQFPKNPGVDFGGGSIVPLCTCLPYHGTVGSHVPDAALRPLCGTWGEWWAFRGVETRRGDKVKARPHYLCSTEEL